MESINQKDTVEQHNSEEEFKKLFEWFNSNAEKLQGAYQHLETKFTEVSLELEEKNRRLQLTEDNLNALLSSMKPGVLMVSPQLIITTFNASAEKLLEVPADQIIGKHIDDVFSEQSGMGVSIRKALSSPLEVVEDERFVNYKNVHFPAVFKCTAIIDINREVIGIVETFSDVSHLRKMEEETQQLRILSALGEMAATVAHEIRNPLGGIGGYAGLLAKDIPPEDPKRRLVEKIIQGVSSLNKIVSNLLFYTRKTQLRLVRVSLKDYLDEVLDFMSIELDRESREVSLIRHYPDENIEVEVDPEKFQQVLLNLLMNAVHALGEQGEIRVDLSKEKSTVQILIQDNGCGIPEENLLTIFNPFFTTKEQGTGLGLAIVKKIIDLHGGQISVKSEVGVGTTFKIQLKSYI